MDGRLIPSAERRAVREMATVLAGEVRMKLLAQLGHGQQSLLELAEHIDCDYWSVSEALAELVDHGYVRQCPTGSPQIYELTPAARVTHEASNVTVELRRGHTKFGITLRSE